MSRMRFRTPSAYRAAVARGYEPPAPKHIPHEHPIRWDHKAQLWKCSRPEAEGGPCSFIRPAREDEIVTPIDYGEAFQPYITKTDPVDNYHRASDWGKAPWDY